MARPRMERIYYTTNFESISVNVTDESLELIKNTMREKNITQTDLWKKYDLGLTKDKAQKFFSKKHIRMHLLENIVKFLEIKALIRPLAE